jgi:hypothetical protein
VNHAVDLPRPHGEGPAVPPMWQAELDPATLDQLFADLATAAEVLSVRGKADPRVYAAADPLTLAAARNRLTAGDLTAVQLRYRYDGHEWADTLLRAPGGFRLVRCQVSAD